MKTSSKSMFLGLPGELTLYCFFHWIGSLSIKVLALVWLSWLIYSHTFCNCVNLKLYLRPHWIRLCFVGIWKIHMPLKIKMNKTCRKQCRYFSQKNRVISRRKLSTGTLICQLYCVYVIRLQWSYNSSWIWRVFNFMTLNCWSLQRGSLRSNSPLLSHWKLTSQRTAAVVEF